MLFSNRDLKNCSNGTYNNAEIIIDDIDNYLQTKSQNTEKEFAAKSVRRRIKIIKTNFTTLINNKMKKITILLLLISIQTFAQCWQSAANGVTHSVAIGRDGSLWAWGRNNHYQLGNGTNTDVALPQRIGTATNWKSVTAAGEHTFAIKTNGTLWYWGWQATTGIFWQQTVPTQVGTDSDWQVVTTGDNHTVALKTDGTLWAWGTNSSGQLGIGSISAADQPTQVGTDSGWTVGIAVGLVHTAAIRVNGTLWTWGTNNDGQLGGGISRATPAQVGTATDWNTITAGNRHTVGTKFNGTLWAWGDNGSYQLGDGTTTDRNTPTQLGTATNWQTVATNAMGFSTYAVKANGTLWRWGTINGGNVTTPTQLGTDTNWENVFYGENHIYGKKTNGSLWGLGFNSNGQLGIGTYSYTPTLTDIVCPETLVIPQTCWKNVSKGDNYTVAVKTDNSLWGWGHNNYGQLGDGTNTDKNTPTQIGTSGNWKTVAAGANHTVAVKTDGTLWAWGYNNYGQLGDGTTVAYRNAPVRIGTATNWASVATGISHTVAIKTDGTLWAWGKNDYSQLGDGSYLNQNAPIQIGTATNWKSVAVGMDHTLAIKTDNTLWAWGRNNYGQLGDTTYTNREQPVQIGFATDWQLVSTRLNYSTAKKANGALYTWGGPDNPANIPTQLVNGSDWKSISEGTSNTLGIKTNGTLWIWQLEESGSFVQPVQVGAATNWQSIAAGNGDHIAIRTDGSIWSWGINTYGQIGDGTNINKIVPKALECYTSVLANEAFESSNKLKIYPNPVREMLSISFDKQIDSVAFYNMLGQQVLMKSVNDINASIDVSTLRSGTYFVKVTTGNLFKTVQIIKL